MHIYKAYNLPIIYPVLHKAFQYSLAGEYPAFSSDSDYATIPSEHDILMCYHQGHMCHLNTSLYPIMKLLWCLYALFINSVEKIKCS